MIRDIPATEISAGSNVTNLSQLMHETLLKEYEKADAEYRKPFYERLYPGLALFDDERSFVEASLKAEGENPQTFILGVMPNFSDFRHFVSLDTRSREMRNKTETTQHLNFVVRKYRSGLGMEYFISFEDELGYLYGFTRLFLIEKQHAIHRAGLGDTTGLIRELHVYGNLQALNKEATFDAKVQHTGLGKQLLDIAEKLSKQAGYERLSVISGVGVREYYAKLGYALEGTYMVKSL